jgi:hypothetical protein
MKSIHGHIHIGSDTDTAWSETYGDDPVPLGRIHQVVHLNGERTLKIGDGINTWGNLPECTSTVRDMGLLPQSIAYTALGNVPVGYDPAIFDATPITILGRELPDFTSSNSYGMVASSTSDYEVPRLQNWKTFSEVADNRLNCWCSQRNTFINGVGDQTLSIDFGQDRTLGDIELFPRDIHIWLGLFPKKLQLLLDGVLVYEMNDVAPASQTSSIIITELNGSRGRKLDFRCLRLHGVTSDYHYVAIGHINISFAEASAGQIAISDKLRVAYVEDTLTKLSAAMDTLGYINTADLVEGKNYVYVDIAASGSVSGFGVNTYGFVVEETRPVGQNPLTDLYMPLSKKMLDTADNEIRRVYIGFIEYDAGNIVDIYSYATSDRFVVPADGTIIDNPYGGWNVQATQDGIVKTSDLETISGLTVGTTPVIVRRS